MYEWQVYCDYLEDRGVDTRLSRSIAVEMEIAYFLFVNVADNMASPMPPSGFGDGDGYGLGNGDGHTYPDAYHSLYNESIYYLDTRERNHEN